jgi:hypothetical protein
MRHTTASFSSRARDRTQTDDRHVGWAYEGVDANGECVFRLARRGA